MSGWVYKFSLMAGLAVMAANLLTGKTLITAGIRTGVVFFGSIFIFVMFLNLLKLGIAWTEVKPKPEADEDEENEDGEEPNPEMAGSPKKALTEGTANG